MIRRGDVMISKALTDDLKDIVGEDGIHAGSSALEPYLDAGGKSTGLVRVLPRDSQDAMDIMHLARGERLNVFSVRTRYMPEGLEGKQGLLLDPARMDYIKNIDARNMMGYIGAGVTFEQLKPKLDEVGMRILIPASAESPYVMRSYMDRDILVGEVCYRHNNLSIFHAALADGDMWIAGSQQMGGEGNADFREDQGTQLSPFFGASEDIFGIPVYGVIYLYPKREMREVLSFGFPDLEGALDFSYKVSKEDHCFELVGGDSLFWSILCNENTSSAEALAGELPPWTVLLSIEHKPELVELQKELVMKDAKAMGGKELPADINETLASQLERPWYLWERPYYRGSLKKIFYYAFKQKVPELFSLVEGKAREAGLEAARCFVPVYFGGSFYCESDLHFPPDREEQAGKTWRDAYNSLLLDDVLVDKPTGELAKMVFGRAESSYIEMIRRFKRIVDPEGRVNPGQLLEGI
jgi:FAD/FMN-containing dehydrogenase